MLENKLVFARGVDRQYSPEFAEAGAKIGYTINVRRPPRFIGTFGPALNVEDTNETYLPVTLTSQFHVDVQYTTADKLLSMDMFRERVISPVIATVANRVDSDGLYFGYQNTANSVGTPGIPLASFLPPALARGILSAEAANTDITPQFCIDPITNAYASDGIKGLYNPQAKIGEVVERGLIAKQFAGLDWYEDQNVVTFTTGAQGGSPVLNGNTTGAFMSTGWANNGFIQTTGWTATTGVVKVGDVIQIAGVYPANPQSRTQYGNFLKQFVVLPPAGYAVQPSGAASPGLVFNPATLTTGTFNAATGVYTSAGGGGGLSILIGEACITGGQFQNVVTTGAFASNSALTVNGGTGNAGKASPQAMVYMKNAFALGFADLPLPGGVIEAARANDADIGMSIRLITQYTINNDSEPTRADVLYGYAGLYRSMAVRIAC